MIEEMIEEMKRVSSTNFITEEIVSKRGTCNLALKWREMMTTCTHTILMIVCKQRSTQTMTCVYIYSFICTSHQFIYSFSFLSDHHNPDPF